jgi:hypothetical protein
MRAECCHGVQTDVPVGARHQRMEVLRDFLDELKRRRYARGNFLGMLNVLIGRNIKTAEAETVSTGLTWRALAEALKNARWDPEIVRELGLNPETLPPRDRQRYWYLAIAHARVDSEQATAAGNRFAETLRSAGYEVSPEPGAKTKKQGKRRS